MPGSTYMVDAAFTYANNKYRGRLVKNGNAWALTATLNGNPLKIGTSFPVPGTKVVFYPGAPGKNGRLQIEAGGSTPPAGARASPACPLGPPSAAPAC